MNYFEAICQINELINDTCELKNRQDIKDAHNKKLLVDPLFIQTENLIRDLYKDLPDHRQQMIDDLGVLIKNIADDDNRHQLDSLQDFLMIMEDQIREKEMLDKMDRSAPSERFQSLTAALMSEKEKSRRLELLINSARVDTLKWMNQAVALRQALNIGSLILLFLLTVIFQLLLHKTNWQATGILAGILLVMALILVFEDEIKNLLSIYWLSRRYITTVFAIAGIVIAGYFMYLFAQDLAPGSY